MRNRGNTWLWILAALLIVLFVWGTEQVAVMPLQTGEVYPYYSSLRADPLGAKALYESFAALPELRVSRLYKQRSGALESGSALLVLGVDPGPWRTISEDTLAGYERLLESGGRLVIAFLPVDSIEIPSEPPGTKVSLTALKDHWNIRLVYLKRERKPSDSPLPRISALYFEPGPEWQVIAHRADRAVAVERPLKGGSIVLVADSYPLSNEGLREDRDPLLIANLIGNNHAIQFDENHFGVSEQGGVAVLMRKYGLEGALAVLMIAAALFMWSSASSFLPPRENHAVEAVAGRESQEGLAALLRRSVAENELLDTCFREWSRTAQSARVAQAVETEIARRRGEKPVETYRAARQAIMEKR